MNKTSITWLKNISKSGLSKEEGTSVIDMFRNDWKFKDWDGVANVYIDYQTDKACFVKVSGVYCPLAEDSFTLHCWCPSKFVRQCRDGSDFTIPMWFFENKIKELF